MYFLNVFVFPVYWHMHILREEYIANEKEATFL